MKKKSSIKRVIRYIGKYKFYLILSMVMALATVAGQLYIPVLQGNAIDNIIAQGNVDFVAISKILLHISITMAGVALLQWTMNTCNNRITYSIVRDIRREAFAKIQRLPVKYIDSHTSGEIVSKVIADVDQFADGLLMGFTQFFSGIVTIVGTLAFIIIINWKIAMVVILITPLSFFVAAFVSKKTYRMFREQSAVRGEQTGFIDEILGNEKVVQAYSYEDRAIDKFDEMNERLQKCSLRAIFFSSVTNPSTRFVNNVVYAMVTLTGAFAVISNPLTFSVGKLQIFLSYAM